MPDPLQVLRVDQVDETNQTGKPTVRLYWWIGQLLLHEQQFTLDERGELAAFDIGAAWDVVLEDLGRRGWPKKEPLVRYAELEARAKSLDAKLVASSGSPSSPWPRGIPDIEFVDVKGGDFGDYIAVPSHNVETFDEMCIEVTKILDRVLKQRKG